LPGADDASVLVQTHAVPTTEDETAAAGGALAREAMLLGAESKEVDVQSLVSKPEAVFDMMGKQVGSLEEEMKNIHLQNQEAIAKQEQTFEAKLMEQRRQNAEVRAHNEELSNDIAKLTSTNRQLWQRGKELQTDADHQRAVVKGMQAKISDASEYAALQLQDLADVDHPDESVLRELDNLDNTHQSESAHKQNLDTIAGLGSSIKAKPPLSMLAVSGDTKANPVSILKGMEESLAHLNAEQQESEKKLRAIFVQKFEAEAHEHKDLEDENTRLTAKKAVLTAMFTRLTTAVQHLEEVSSGLKKAITALGTFSEKIGRDSLEAQSIGEKKVALADVGGGSDANTARHSPSEWLSRTWTRLTGRQ
jgi:chromosome segregation ATPase